MGGSGDGRVLDGRGQGRGSTARYLRRNFEARFPLQLARQDVGLATELRREYNVPMHLAALCEQELMAAIGRGWADQDASIVLTLQESERRCRYGYRERYTDET